LPRAPAHLPPVEHAEPAARCVPEEDVLGDGELRKQQQFLVNRGDAALARLARGERLEPLVADPDGSGIGSVHAGDDLDERGLARAVLPEQRVDLTRPNLKVDVLQHANAGERL
jgi:hypothetical protein